MNCADFNSRLDDYLDGLLDPVAVETCRAHLNACDECSERVAWELRLRRQLRSLPVPDPSPGFESRVLMAAAGNAQHRPGTRREFFAYAVAASLALGIGLSAWLGTSGPDTAAPAMHSVTVAQETATPVRLVFRSPRDLSGVTIQIQLPEDVELAGHPGRRELSWQANLRAGTNVLEVPVIVHGGEGGVMTASISNGRDYKQLQVLIRPRSPQARSPKADPALITAATPEVVQHA